MNRKKMNEMKGSQINLWIKKEKEYEKEVRKLSNK